MTWVTLSNGTCPPFFPLEVDIFDLARPLNSRGKKGVSPRQKCRGVRAPIVAVLRGKTVTHVMRSCLSRVGERVPRSRTLHKTSLNPMAQPKKRSFRRDAETSTRDARATQVSAPLANAPCNILRRRARRGNRDSDRSTP